MNTQTLCQNICIAILLAFTAIVNTHSASNDFPLREKYKDVPTIELQTLSNEYTNTIIIDVRSKAEYEVIHIAKSHNIPLSNRGFVNKVKKLREDNPNKKIILYCNGHTCAKSYKATKKLSDEKIDNCLAFDAGIFDWIQKNPQHSALLGKEPADLSKLISAQEFKSRTLKKEEFEQKLSSTNNAIVIDIREAVQRKFNPNYKSIRNIPFTNIVKAIKNKKYQDKTLFIFDAVGKQVKWLQYYLKDNQYQNYYFLDKGVKSLQI
ncbi:rhodanese-like domain-containing protein [Spartinivicinus ruber]|uniref:rhodanese-like domain-containing protein n=1 Tax=Spartinivicinus ruber TaxID=2683272 RepID=UPI0013D7895C|nr:rhodanese-like domain-containing protein [Spartinivicinus ruber]